MNVLFDGCVPRPLRGFLVSHIVKTAPELGWGALKNGDLLRVAEEQFDLLLTADQNLRYQQNLNGRRLLSSSCQRMTGLSSASTPSASPQP